MSPKLRIDRLALFLCIALGGAAFDLATKSAIFERLGEPPSLGQPVIGDVLELRASYNPGALWGLARGWQYSSLMFATLSVAAVLAIFFWLFVKGGSEDARLTAALGLITAGALGNCYDRIVLGHVRDFVHFHVESVNFNFPIFNFADNMLVVGAAGLMLLALKAEPGPAARKEPAADAEVSGV